MLATSTNVYPPRASSSAALERTTGRTSSTSRTIVRSGRTTWIVVGAVYSGARDAPGSSTGVSPALGAGATGWAKSAGVSPILALAGLRVVGARLGRGGCGERGAGGEREPERRGCGGACGGGTSW